MFLFYDINVLKSILFFKYTVHHFSVAIFLNMKYNYFNYPLVFESFTPTLEVYAV